MAAVCNPVVYFVLAKLESLSILGPISTMVMLI